VLLEKLIDLDYSTVPVLNERNEGTHAQWLAVFDRSPETFGIVTEGDAVAGYWHFVALAPKAYDVALSGRMLDGDLTADKVLPLDKKGDYDAYMVMWTTHPNHRSPALSQALRSSFAQALLGFAERGRIIHYVCGTAYTAAGGRLMQRIGMAVHGPHQDGGNVYRGKASVIVRKILERTTYHRSS
jgi:hypothetical protein